MQVFLLEYRVKKKNSLTLSCLLPVDWQTSAAIDSDFLYKV